MDKKHLPYNVLLVIAVAAIGLMAICIFGLRGSSFAVRVGYALPQPVTVPASSSPAEQTSRQSARQTSSQTGESVSQVPEKIEVETALEPEELQAFDEEDGRVTSVQFPLQLNEASYEQLLFIPGVGDVMAQRITQYRDHLGGAYERLDQLMDIKGIGAGTYLKITAYLYLDDWDPDGEVEDPETEGLGQDAYDNEEDDQDQTDLEGQI